MRKLKITFSEFVCLVVDLCFYSCVYSSLYFKNKKSCNQVHRIWILDSSDSVKLFSLNYEDKVDIGLFLDRRPICKTFLNREGAVVQKYSKRIMLNEIFKATGNVHILVPHTAPCLLGRSFSIFTIITRHRYLRFYDDGFTSLLENASVRRFLPKNCIIEHGWLYKKVPVVITAQIQTQYPLAKEIANKSKQKNRQLHIISSKYLSISETDIKLLEHGLKSSIDSLNYYRHPNASKDLDLSFLPVRVNYIDPVDDLIERLSHEVSKGDIVVAGITIVILQMIELQSCFSSIRSFVSISKVYKDLPEVVEYISLMKSLGVEYMPMFEIK